MFAPEWTLTDVARHSVDWWLTTEDLPVAENRVTTGKDGRVHLTYTPTNGEEADQLYAELRKILNHVGMAAHHVFRKNFYQNMSIPLAGCAHQAGTCRSAPTRPTRSSTSTARPTKWTTSTSWTPASSPASGR
jgi:hypothetical protein